MLAYLIYDTKDIKKNSNYIQWIIDEGKSLSINIILLHCNIDFDKLNLPNFVINRSRKHIYSVYFESKGIKVFNNSFITKLTNDKYETYLFLKNKFPMIKTKLLIKEPTYPCVLKSVDGHGGNEVYLLNSVDDYNNLKLLDSKKYIYQSLARKGKDLRVFVIGKTIIACVLRSNNKSFKSNYSLGGDISLYELNSNELNLITQIINEFDFGLVGIDFLFDKNNNLILNEIEDAVGSRMLSKLTDINIINLYLNFILKNLN